MLLHVKEITSNSKDVLKWIPENIKMNILEIQNEDDVESMTTISQ